MLLNFPLQPPRRRRRRARRSQAATPPVVALTLVSATFNTDDGAVVTLVFDRAVSIAAANAGAFGVIDGPGMTFFGGSFVALVDPVTVRVEFSADDSAEGPDVLLNASDANGIVAVDDGAAWSGAVDLVLPFS